jgi:hypothetical protein
MVDKAGLLDLERSRQAGAQLLSLREECAVERIDRLFDEIDALSKKWQERLTLETVNLSKAYIDGKINIILVIAAPNGQDYRLVIRRAPHWEIECNAPGWAGSERAGATMSGGMPHWDNGKVYVLPAEFIQGPDSSVLSSFVWLDLIDGRPGGGGQFLYFSLYFGTFKFLSTPGNWELDAACGSAVQNCKLAGKVIEGASQVGRDGTSKLLDIGGRLSIKPDFYELLVRLRLTLFDDRIGLGLTEGSDSLFKVGDVIFGPFNL